MCKNYIMTYNSYSYKRGVTEFYQESQNPFCLVVTLIVVYKKYYTSIYIFYILFISRQIQRSKNYQNPTNTSKDTYKNNYLFKLFSLLNKSDSRSTTDLVMYQCDSHENMKDFIMTSPHVIPHPILSQIVNVNQKCKCKPRT